MRPSPEQLMASARTLADEVLFPNALAADAAPGVPETQLDALAEAGLYAMSTYCPPEVVVEVIEALAGGCLTTTFVYTQHLGAAAAAHTSEGPLRDELAADLTAGTKRGGVAFAQMLRPGAPVTVAEPVDGGWSFSGAAPWVTGWGHIDVMLAAARHGDDIVWALIDAVDTPTLTSSQVGLAVIEATQTRVLHYDDHFVPDSRITSVENYAEWKAGYRLGLRINGSLALGVASRCCRLLDDAAMTAKLDAVRAELDALDPTEYDAISAARAEASLFAVRAATALVARTGGNAVMLSDHAQRLMREAMFVVVQGQTPEIKAAMLTRLSS